MRELSFMNQTFATASIVWIERRRRELKSKTLEVYNSYVNQLMPFFGERLIRDIDADQISEYQEQRANAGKGASAINHELECILIPMLKASDRWHRLKKFYRRVPAPVWRPPKVMTQAQEDALFTMASNNPDLLIAFLACSIMNNTTATQQELRNVRIIDVILDGPRPHVHFRVETVKTNFRAPGSAQRGRKVPLNEIAMAMFRRAIDRTKALGAWHPEHYIFPFRSAPGRYDATRPGSAWFIRNSFRKLKQDAYAATEDPIYLEITPHWFRHQSITKMLEQGVPDETVMAVAGHVSTQMLRHYSHHRMEAKAVAVDSLLASGVAAVKKRPQRESQRAEMLRLAAALIKAAGADR